MSAVKDNTFSNGMDFWYLKYQVPYMNIMDECKKLGQEKGRMVTCFYRNMDKLVFLQRFRIPIEHSL